MSDLKPSFSITELLNAIAGNGVVPPGLVPGFELINNCDTRVISSFLEDLAILVLGIFSSSNIRGFFVTVLAFCKKVMSIDCVFLDLYSSFRNMFLNQFAEIHVEFFDTEDWTFPSLETLKQYFSQGVDYTISSSSTLSSFFKQLTGTKLYQFLTRATRWIIGFLFAKSISMPFSSSFVQLVIGKDKDAAETYDPVNFFSGVVSFLSELKVVSSNWLSGLPLYGVDSTYELNEQLLEFEKGDLITSSFFFNGTAKGHKAAIDLLARVDILEKKINDYGVKIPVTNSKISQESYRFHAINMKGRILDVRRRVVAEIGGKHKRVEPFSYTLIGDPGVGKSILNDFIIQVAAEILDLSTECAIYMKSPEDAYDSTYQLSNWAYVLDDFGNKNPDFTMNDPLTNAIFEYVNTHTIHAVKANVDEKGKFPMLPMIVAFTANKPDHYVSKVFMESFAVLRRMGIRIRVVLDDPNATDGRLNFRCFRSAFNDPKTRYFPWKFLVSVPTKDGFVLCSHPILVEARKTRPDGDQHVAFDSLMQFLRETMREHFGRIDEKNMDINSNVEHCFFCENQIFDRNSHLCPIDTNPFNNPFDLSDEPVKLKPKSAVVVQFPKLNYQDKAEQFVRGLKMFKYVMLEYPKIPFMADAVSRLFFFRHLQSILDFVFKIRVANVFVKAIVPLIAHLLFYFDKMLEVGVYFGAILCVFVAVCLSGAVSVSQIYLFYIYVFAIVFLVCIPLFSKSKLFLFLNQHRDFITDLKVHGVTTKSYFYVFDYYQQKRALRDRNILVHIIFGTGALYFLSKIVSSFFGNNPPKRGTFRAEGNVTLGCPVDSNGSQPLNSGIIPNITSEVYKRIPYVFPAVEEGKAFAQGVRSRTGVDLESFKKVLKGLNIMIKFDRGTKGNFDSCTSSPCTAWRYKEFIFFPFHFLDKVMSDPPGVMYSLMPRRDNKTILIPISFRRENIVYNEMLDMAAIFVGSAWGRVPKHWDDFFFSTSDMYSIPKTVSSATIFSRPQDFSFVENFLLYSETLYPGIRGSVDIGWNYENVQTKSGDCGALVAINWVGRFVIVGFHVARHVEEPIGIARRLSTTDMDLLIENFVNKHPIRLAVNSPFLPEPLCHNEIQMDPIHLRSEINNYRKANIVMEAIGTFPHIPKISYKSEIEKSPLYDYFVKDFHSFGGANIGPPKFDGNKTLLGGWESPFTKMFDKQHLQENNLSFETYKFACQDYVYGFKSRGYFEYFRSKFGDYRFLTLNEALNGMKEFDYVGPLNRQTSAGWRFRGKKSQYLDEFYVDGMNQVQLNRQAQEAFDQLWKSFEEGGPMNQLFFATLKDEARDTAKFARVFFVGDFLFCLLSKMVTGFMYEFIMRFKDASECMVGVNCASPEWGKLAKRLSRFGLNNVIAGDYTGYDIYNKANTIWSASQYVFMEICENLGASERNLKLIHNYFSACPWHFVAIFGDVFLPDGGVKSGDFLTSLENSVQNSINMRWCFYASFPDSPLGTFQKHVELATFGDDDIFGVSTAALEFFNFETIVENMKKINWIYTSENKDGSSYRSKSLLEANFLKRKFVYSEELQIWLAPLEEKSILKSLCWTLPSKKVSVEHQLSGVLMSANLEWWMHGRKVFDSYHPRLMECAEKFKLQHLGLVLKSYDEITESYREGSFATHFT